MYFIPLAPLNSPEFVVPAIADALGFVFQGPSEPKTQLFSCLRAARGEMLLVLDNLEHLAGLAASGDAERVARLFGAAEAIREAIGAPLLPVDHPAYDRDVAALRTQLDNRAVTRAWAEGRAMTREQAISMLKEIYSVD